MLAASPLPFALVLRTAAVLGSRRALARAGAGVLFARPLGLARIESATDVRIAEKRILEGRGFVVGSGDRGGARGHAGQSGQGQFSKISSAQVQVDPPSSSPIDSRGISCDSVAGRLAILNERLHGSDSAAFCKPQIAPKSPLPCRD